MFKLISKFFLALIFSVLSTSAYAIPILSPGDSILGGVSDGTNFVVGTTGVNFTANNWPGAEPPTALIDGQGQKYLNFAGDAQPSGAVITPATSGTVANSLTLWTANDAEPRDPASYQLYGTNTPITATSPGDTILLSSFTLIDSGTLSLPSSRNGGGVTPLDAANSQTITFPNSAAFDSYLILFPTVKDSGNANSMQIAELQLEYIPPIPTLSLFGLGLMSLILVFVSRRTASEK